MGPPPTGRRNTKMMVGGIVLTATSAATLATGLYLMPQGAAAGQAGDSSSGAARFDGGVTLFTLGLAQFFTGIGLWVFGALPPDRPRAGIASLVPQVGVGPRSARLTWSF